MIAVSVPFPEVQRREGTVYCKVLQVFVFNMRKGGEVARGCFWHILPALCEQRMKTRFFCSWPNIKVKWNMLWDITKCYFLANRAPDTPQRLGSQKWQKIQVHASWPCCSTTPGCIWWPPYSPPLWGSTLPIVETYSQMTNWSFVRKK